MVEPLKIFLKCMSKVMVLAAFFSGVIYMVTWSSTLKSQMLARLKRYFLQFRNWRWNAYDGQNITKKSFRSLKISVIGTVFYVKRHSCSLSTLLNSLLFPLCISYRLKYNKTSKTRARITNLIRTKLPISLDQNLTEIYPR